MGQHLRKVVFVISGLFSQNYITEERDVIIKYFFPEQRMATSLVAILVNQPSQFYIEAIEDTTVFEYDFFKFKQLFENHPNISQFYIRQTALDNRKRTLRNNNANRNCCQTL